MTKRPATDIRQDEHNANRGTDRGREMIEASLRDYGAGRSILADKHGVAIAGNKTLEAAEKLGLPVRIVETAGDELVVVQRTDLDLEHDTTARELAYADNRASEVSLDWSVDVISADLDTGVDLSGLFDEAELIDLFDTAASAATEPQTSESEDAPERATQTPVFRPAIAVAAMERLERALGATGATSRGEALLMLCDAFLGDAAIEL